MPVGRSAGHRRLCGNIVEEKHNTRYIHLQNCSGVPITETEKVYDEHGPRVHFVIWLENDLHATRPGSDQLCRQSIAWPGSSAHHKGNALERRAYGLVSGSFFLLYALSSMLVTAWSDRIGTKSPGAACNELGHRTSRHRGVRLLLPRVVLGAGEGPSYGTSVSATTPWLPADRRAFGLGVVTFGSAVGPAVLAPPLTFLIVVVGWRSAFALLGGIGFLWVIIWLLVGREHPAARRMPVHET
jgi:MFS family permease